MSKRVLLAAVAAIAALAAVPGAAGAHVTVHPETAPADSYTRIDFRVPNEEENASTKSVKVQFPAGIYATSYQSIPGWKVTVSTTKLATPVKMEDDTLTTQTKEVEFTATGGGIEPGQFQDFGLSISTPDKSGEALKFPAVQTYSNGDVVRWIGAAGSESPAPLLTLTAAESESGHMTSTAAADASSDSGSTGTVAWIALALGALALLMGIAILAGSRRRG